MNKNDKYVHSMDWGGDEISLDNFTNYRKYQYDLIGNYVGKSILEVGSGGRGFTKQLLANNKSIERIYSIEPSEVLFRMAEGKYRFPDHVEFECRDVFDLDSSKIGKFDTVVFIHVLEHIEEDSRALTTIHDCLEPNGFVLIEVPALPWLFSAHDKTLGHYRRYNKRMLKSIVDIEKYEIIKMWYQDPIGVLGFLYFFKLRKITLKSDQGTELAKNHGVTYEKYVIPFESKIEKFIKFPFGLSLTMILKKR